MDFDSILREVNICTVPSLQGTSFWIRRYLLNPTSSYNNSDHSIWIQNKTIFIKYQSFIESQLKFWTFWEIFCRIIGLQKFEKFKKNLKIFRIFWKNFEKKNALTKFHCRKFFLKKCNKKYLGEVEKFHPKSTPLHELWSMYSFSLTWILSKMSPLKQIFRLQVTKLVFFFQYLIICQSSMLSRFLFNTTKTGSEIHFLLHKYFLDFFTVQFF